MKVVIVYQYYQGHSAPGHSLIYEYTQYLANQGHEVTVISGETGYMHSQKPQRPWYKRLVFHERDGAVNVVRTYTYSELHRSYLGRLLSFISFFFTAPIGLMRVEKPDVIFASSPPIFSMFSVWLVCWLRKIPMVLEVRDLWPESAVQMGVLRNKLLISTTSWIERVLYNRATRIVTLTEGIYMDIKNRGWPAEKLEVITCGVDSRMLFDDPLERQRIREENGWSQRSVVLYLGAIGQANNLDLVLDAAAHCEDPKVLFVLIGDGMMKAHLQRRVASEQLHNVVILPAIAKELARSYISAADLCLVTLLDIPLFKGAIPTKLLDYMACSKPVLCGVAGEAAAIIEDAQAGIVFPADYASLLSSLTKLLVDPEYCRLLGENGARYVRAHFNAEVSRARIEEVLVRAVN